MMDLMYRIPSDDSVTEYTIGKALVEEKEYIDSIEDQKAEKKEQEVSLERMKQGAVAVTKFGLLTAAFMLLHIQRLPEERFLQDKHQKGD